MKTYLNILIGTDLPLVVRAHTKNSELGCLFKALAVPARGSPMLTGMITGVMSRFRQKKQKKSKREDLPPTPPIEEKNKKK